MKKHLLLSCFLLIVIAMQGNAQAIRDILKDKNIPLTFYGVDFTAAKIIGDANARPGDIVLRQYAGINDLLIKENDKYDVAGAFNRTTIKANPAYVARRNSSIDSTAIISSNPKDYARLTEANIVKIVQGFDTGGEPGYGILFLVDGMYKSRSMMSAWVAVFDNATKKVILAERHEGVLGMAFSFRNYWAAGLKNIIKSVAAANKKKIIGNDKP